MMFGTRGSSPSSYGDFTQRLNSRYCVFVLCLLAVSHVVIVYVYYGDTVECYCPSHTAHSQCEMMKMNCRTNKATLYGFTTDILPQTIQEQPPFSVSTYYQFVSLILLLQALLFFVPTILHKEMTALLAICPEQLAQTGVEALQATTKEEREVKIKAMSEHVRMFCKKTKMPQNDYSDIFGWLQGHKLIFVQLLSKLLYIGNVIGQFFMLDGFLGMPFHFYGWQIIAETSPLTYVTDYLSQIGVDDIVPFSFNVTTLAWVHFPTNVLCKFTTMRVSSIQGYTIHCLLPANGLNKLVFMCVWFLLFLVGMITALSTVIAICKLVAFYGGMMSARGRLQQSGAFDDEERSTGASNQVSSFEKNYLQLDGCLLIGYIESAAGRAIANEVVKGLWNIYKKNVPTVENNASRPAIPPGGTTDDSITMPDNRDYRRLEEPPMELGAMGTRNATGSDGEQPPPYGGYSEKM